MSKIFNEMLTELYEQYCRLKGYSKPTSPIEAMIDKATGQEQAHMEEFARWVVTELVPRFDPEAVAALNDLVATGSNATPDIANPPPNEPNKEKADD